MTTYDDSMTKQSTGTKNTGERRQLYRFYFFLLRDSFSFFFFGRHLERENKKKALPRTKGKREVRAFKDDTWNEKKVKG